MWRFLAVLYLFVYSFVSQAQECADFQAKYVEVKESGQGQSERLADLQRLFSEIDTLRCPGPAAQCVGLMGLIHIELNLMDDAYDLYARQGVLAKTSERDDLNYSAHQNMGYWYIAQDRFRESIPHTRLGLALAEQISDSSHIANSCQNLSLSFYQIGQFDSSLVYSQRLMAIGTALQDDDAIGTAIQLFALVRAETEGVDEKTLLDLKACLILFQDEDQADSRFSIMENVGYLYERSDRLDSALVYYQKASYIAENEMNSVDDLSWMNERIGNINKTIMARQKRTREIQLALAIALALITALAIVLIRNKQHKLLLERARIEKLESEKAKEATEAMLFGQDKERQRIAEDLHDSLGGMLLDLGTQLSALPTSGGDIAHRVAGLRQGIEETASEVRRISHDLHSSILLKLGLSAALDQLATTLAAQQAVTIHWETTDFDEDSCDMETKTAIYRIVQECTTNIVRHSKATEAYVNLFDDGETITLMIEDNGIGFDMHETVNRQGIGLTNMKNRVERVCGRWTIDSAISQGTTIITEIPIAK